MIQNTTRGIIVDFRIENLFGKYDYHLNFSKEDSDGTSGRRISLLYGGNGSGKTNILTVLWHLMSESDRSGHRSALGRTPFGTLRVTLDNGHVISVKKESLGISNYNISVHDGSRELVSQSYRMTENGHVDKGDMSIDPLLRDIPFEPGSLEWRAALADLPSVYSNDSYIEYLAQLSVNPHFLADDRRIHNDDFEDEALKRRSRMERHLNTRVPSSFHVDADYYSDFKPALAQELTTAIRRVNENIRQLVYNGNTTGSRSTEHIYLDLLRRIASTGSESGGSQDASYEFMSLVLSVAERTKKYSEFGLIAPLSGGDYLDLLKRLRGDRWDIAQGVLKPYLEAQNARMDALADAESLIRTLLDRVNGFFDGKYIKFDMRKGIKISSEAGELLQPEQLSSGERQLLLLVLNTVLARTGTRLFLIDEPEISLNVKWQRRLTEALLACAEGSDVQFIMATHSVEIITGNAKNLARLVSIS
jgi:energy-coupling factor transporter ATP-binding protein EcfA2